MTQLDAAPVDHRPVAPVEPFSIRSARYGASVSAVVLGAYLLMTSQLAIAVLDVDPEVAQWIITQFVIAVAVVLAGILVAPTSPLRRIAAAAVALAVVGAHIGLTAAQSIATPQFVLFATLAVCSGSLGATAAWLVLRGRPAYTLGLLLAFALIPVLIERLGYAGLPTPTRDLIVLVASGVLGISIAWVAAAFSRLADSDRAVTT